MNREVSGLIEDWPQYLTAALLVMVDGWNLLADQLIKSF